MSGALVRLALLPLLLVACAPDTKPPARAPCEEVTRYRDVDGDGHGDDAQAFTACNEDRGVATGGDCDDADPTVHPDAAEHCDGLDQDCDGAVDDLPVDATDWYADADADGYGAIADTLRACEAPAGYLADASDCDDTRADVSPGGTERCNGVDDDCDGATDDAAAVDGPTWYADLDEDGWGDEGDASDACEAPALHVADAGDCDDADPAVNPGATEVCNGLDDDCDLGTDDAEATDATAWFVDADRDGHGDPAATVLACDVPSDASALDDDCDDTDPTAFPGASETCDDADDDCDGTVDESPVDAPTWYADADLDGFGGAAAIAACEAPPGTVGTATDCDDGDAAVLGAPTWYADADGDGHGDPAAPQLACTRPAGFVANTTDCDDGDGATSPDAVESCDGADDDCDGTVDEPDAADAPSWYADADDDGYGDPDVATTACSAPVGSVAPATDCDDADATRHPGASEADCDDPVDYNCDGSVGTTDADGDGHVACEECDDADPAMYAGAPWYADADGDTFGDPALSAIACGAPAGHVADASDCDDADTAVHPGATESCTTPADDDCDGATNERNATACTRWYWDQDEDGYGSTTNACYCEPVGVLTADNRDDCDDGDAATHPGGVEVWGNGADEDCDDVVDVVELAAADALLLGEGVGDAAGYAVSGAGDVDGDGFDDLLIGAPQADPNGAASGLAYLVRGPVVGTLDLSAADAVFLGEAAGDQAGATLAPAGDVDGDGFGDILVGALYSGSAEVGAAYLLRGPLTGTIDLPDADAEWTGRVEDDTAGSALAGGVDLDGDGLPDLLVGASGSDVAARNAGAAFVVSGLLTGTNALASATALLLGDDADDEAGCSVAAAADLDGDGTGDVLVGASADDDAASSSGAVYVLYGPLSGSIDLSLADAKLTGEDRNDLAGSDVDAPGDIDGDGLDDVLVGARGARVGGAAYLVRGAPTGASSLAAAHAIFEGSATGDFAGGSVAGIGDVNADGDRDLLFGAYSFDGDAGDEGAAYVVFGPVTGTTSLADADGIFLGAPNDGLGRSVAAAGDTSGDGFADFLLGAAANDDGGAGAGAAALLLGRP